MRSGSNLVCSENVRGYPPATPNPTEPHRTAFYYDGDTCTAAAVVVVVVVVDVDVVVGRSS